MEDRFCGPCLSAAPAYDSARSLVRYAPPVSTLLHRLKFHGDVSAARALASLGSPVVPPFDLLLPIPLHPARLRARGINQSLVLARRFFPDYQRSIAVDLLVRIKDTVPQLGLDGRQRRRNLHGAFGVTDAAALHGRSVCLVDDVFTTGTTLLECAKTVRKAGAARVDAWTVARAWGAADGSDAGSARATAVVNKQQRTCKHLYR